MPNIGAPELIIILVIALLILGPGKLPEVGASIGKSLREFRKASSDVQEATKLDVSVAPIPPATVDAAAPVAAATAATAAAAVAAAPDPAPDPEAIAAAKATLAAAEAAGVESTPTSTTSGSSAPAN
jgi:TatA/E family protein of Tat protein translocase